MNLQERRQVTQRHLRQLGRRVDRDYLQFVSRSKTARQRRTLLAELGELVADTFQSEDDGAEVTVRLEDVKDLLDELALLDAQDRPCDEPERESDGGQNGAKHR